MAINDDPFSSANDEQPFEYEAEFNLWKSKLDLMMLTKLAAVCAALFADRDLAKEFYLETLYEAFCTLRETGATKISVDKGGVQ